MSQVDNRQNTALSMRTPRARVKGLGASGHGAGHFWLQRLTGASNALLMIAFVVILALMAGRTYPQAVALVSSSKRHSASGSLPAVVVSSTEATST